MTPDQIKLVQETFKSVQPIAPQAADLFYGRLFEIAPEVRPLLPDHLTEQKKKLRRSVHAVLCGTASLDGKCLAAAHKISAGGPGAQEPSKDQGPEEQRENGADCSWHEP